MEPLRKGLPLRPTVLETAYKKIAEVGESAIGVPPDYEMTVTGRWFAVAGKKLLVGFRVTIVDIDLRTANVDCSFWLKESISRANQAPWSDEEATTKLYTLPVNMLHKLRQLLAAFS